MNMAFLCW